MKKIILLYICIAFVHNNTQGQLYDNTFNNNGVWNHQVRTSYNILKSITIQQDGKIIFSGKTANEGTSETSYFMLGRLTTSGSFDNSFNTDGVAEFNFSTDNTNSADKIVFANGSIYACGYNKNNSLVEHLLAKIDLNGSLETSFNGTGYLTQTIGGANTNIPYNIHATTNNKIVALGFSYNTQYHLSGFKVDASGAFDNTFGTNGKIFFNTIGQPIQNSCIQPDNKILAIADNILLRIKTNGNLDSTAFGTNGQVTLSNGVYTDIAIQKNGKIVICGMDSNNDFVAYRYESNGSLDASFGTNGKVIVAFSGTTNVAKAIAIDTTSASGKIFITGYSFYGGTNSYIALARISPSDGTVEAVAEFKPNGLNAEGKDILLQSDGKILIGGNSLGYSIDDLIVTRIHPNFSTVVAGLSYERQDVAEVNLFPNPASQTIHIHSSSNIKDIKVLDILGNEVMNKISSGNTQLDISSLPKGLYQFIITTDQGIGTKKVSIQ